MFIIQWVRGYGVRRRKWWK